MGFLNDVKVFVASGRSSKLSRNDLDAYRDRCLRRIVRHAYDKVPFYHGLFDEAGLTPEDVLTAGDLARLPVIGKSRLRAQPPERILAAGCDPRRLIVRTTTGSTGEPITIYKSKSDEFLFHISRLRVMQNYGLRPRDRMALIGRASYRRTPLSWRFLRLLGLYRQERIDMSFAPERIAEILERVQPDVVTGDVSVLDRVGLVMEGRNHAVAPRFVVTGGGVLTSPMRQRILEGFKAAVLDTYASEEMSIIACECRETGLYHIREDNVIVEVLKDGMPVPEGKRGRVVVTSLHFRAMPFIRYDLGDEAVQGPRTCPCGSPFSTLREISGRSTDFLILPDGRRIYAAATAHVLQKDISWIDRYEFVQESLDSCVVRIVALREPPAGWKEAIKTDLAALLGPGLEIRVEWVREITPSSGGKFRVLRSLLDSRYDGTREDSPFPPSLK